MFRGHAYREARPSRHHHLIHRLNDTHGEWQPTCDEQGFYDAVCDFISREDALKIALSTAQVGTHIHSTKLFSEDIW